MYITICEADDQSKFEAWNRALKTGALGQPRAMGWVQDGRRVYIRGWFMSMYGQNHANIVK